MTREELVEKLTLWASDLEVRSEGLSNRLDGLRAHQRDDVSRKAVALWRLEAATLRAAAEALSLPLVGGGSAQSQPGYDDSASRDASSEAEPSGPSIKANIELLPHLEPSIRPHAQFIDAALTFYHGGPADRAVRDAWQRITNRLTELRLELAASHEERCKLADRCLELAQAATSPGPDETPAPSATETIALWMIERSYATGHGDTIEALLGELEWQAKERARSPAPSGEKI